MRKTGRRKSKLPTMYIVKGNRYRWPLDVYKLWYMYSKLAGETKAFKEWFDPALFSEVWPKEDIKIIKRKGSKLTIEIDLLAGAHRLGLSFLRILHKYNANTVPKEPTAKIHPTQSKKDMKFEALKRARKIYILKQKGIKNLEIAYEVGLIEKELYDYKLAIKNKTFKVRDFDYTKINDWDKGYLNAERTIQRNYRLAKIIISNVKKDIFP